MDHDQMNPEKASALARWAGLRETLAPEKLAELYAGVEEVITRLYAVDVSEFEADFLQPDSRAR